MVCWSKRLVTSVPATARMLRKLDGRKFALRLPVKRSMPWATKILKACSGVRNPYPCLAVSMGQASCAQPSSPLEAMPAELLSFWGNPRSLET